MRVTITDILEWLGAAAAVAAAALWAGPFAIPAAVTVLAVVLFYFAHQYVDDGTSDDDSA